MHDPVLTHHIQLHILQQMLTKSDLRYSELKPQQVEANLFMYHLKQLIKLGLMQKSEKGYTLTRDGKRFADRATLSNMKIYMQPKTIIILTIRRVDGKWLLLQRKHQPFLDYRGFPSGKLYYGETLQAAARRQLHEKSGLSNVPLALKGNVVMHYNDQGKVVNHVNGYVFYGEVPESFDVDFSGQHFQSYFAEEATLLEPPCFKGHQQILEYLKRSDFPFIEECEFQSDF